MKSVHKWMDPKQVTTWLLGAIIFVGTAAFNTWMRANENSRRLDVLEKTVEQMAIQQTKVGEGVTTLQVQIATLGGNIDKVDTKLDGLRTMFNMQTIQRAVKPQ